MTHGPRVVSAEEAKGHAEPLLPEDYEKMKFCVKELSTLITYAQRPHETLYSEYAVFRSKIGFNEEHLKVLDAIFLHMIIKDSITKTLVGLGRTIDYRSILSEIGRAIEKAIRTAFPPTQGCGVEAVVVSGASTQEDVEWALKIRDGVNQFARRLITKGATGDNAVSILDELLKKAKDESNDPNRPTT